MSSDLELVFCGWNKILDAVYSFSRFHVVWSHNPRWVFAYSIFYSEIKYSTSTITPRIQPYGNDCWIHCQHLWLFWLNRYWKFSIIFGWLVNLSMFCCLPVPFVWAGTISHGKPVPILLKAVMYSKYLVPHQRFRNICSSVRAAICNSSQSPWFLL